MSDRAFKRTFVALVAALLLSSAGYVEAASPGKVQALIQQSLRSLSGLAFQSGSTRVEVTAAGGGDAGIVAEGDGYDFGMWPNAGLMRWDNDDGDQAFFGVNNSAYVYLWDSSGGGYDMTLQGSYMSFSDYGTGGWLNLQPGEIHLESVKILSGDAAPEGAVTAPAGSIYLRSGESAQLYVKLSGTGNTGWSSGIGTAP